MGNDNLNFLLIQYFNNLCSYNEYQIFNNFYLLHSIQIVNDICVRVTIKTLVNTSCIPQTCLRWMCDLYYATSIYYRLFLSLKFLVSRQTVSKTLHKQEQHV